MKCTCGADDYPLANKCSLHDAPVASPQQSRLLSNGNGQSQAPEETALTTLQAERICAGLEQQLREALERLTYTARFNLPVDSDGNPLNEVSNVYAYAMGAEVPLLTREQVNRIVEALAKLATQESIKQWLHHQKER